MTPSQIETYVDAAALAVGLPLQAEHRPGVIRYFALAAEFAALLDAVPLTPHDDAAVVFAPVDAARTRDER